MKHPVQKRIFCLIAMIVLLGALALAYQTFDRFNNKRDNSRDVAKKLEAITTGVSSLVQEEEECLQEYMELLSNNAKMTVLSLTDIVKRDGDAAIQNFGTACVVRKNGDSLVLPKNNASSIPKLMHVSVEDPPAPLPACRPFEDTSGAFWSREPQDLIGRPTNPEFMLCYYLRIYGQYYYVQYTRLSDFQNYHLAHVDIDSVMQSLEKSYNCPILGIYEEAGGSQAFYVPQKFRAKYQSVEDLGVSTDTEATFAETVVDGERYVYTVSKAKPAGSQKTVCIVLFIPYEAFYTRQIEKNIILVWSSLILFVLLGVWITGVIDLVRQEIITQSQRDHYSVRRVRIATICLGVISAIVILLVSMFTDALSSIYYHTQICQGDLVTLSAMIDDYGERHKRTTDERNDLYLNYANRIAGLLTSYPELRTAEMLGKMSETIGADYLMIYDDKGQEVVSNAPFVNLAYGTTESSSTYDFRRLIRGVPSIVHETCVDEVTGLERQLIGVRIPDDDISDGYASMIIALWPDNTVDRISAQALIQSASTSEGIAFAVDRDSGTIIYSSEEELVRKNAREQGLAERCFSDELMDFFTLDGEKWYGCSLARENILYYSAVPESILFDGVLINGLIRALLFLAAYLVLAIILLIDYNEETLSDFGGRVVDDHDWIARKDILTKRRTSSHRLSLRQSIRDWWVSKSPAKKALFSFEVLTAIALFIFYRRLAKGEVSDILLYVLHGKWEYGANIFAVTRIVIYAAGAALAIYAIELIGTLLNGTMETKGRTICRMLSGILEYGIGIVTVLFSAEVLGFDTRALLASLGVFSLAISLGAKDFVADIFSGFGIVFTGKYLIGEFVEADGFKGTVWDVGIRTTTLVSRDGIITQVNNRNVTNVKNLSRMNSRITLKLCVSRNQPLAQIEDVIKKNLPIVAERNEDVISGLDYKGVSSMDFVTRTLQFSAACQAEKGTDARNRLNVELTKMFSENGVPVNKVYPKE